MVLQCFCTNFIVSIYLFNILICNFYYVNEGCFYCDY
jgi:hypothetical protein